MKKRIYIKIDEEQNAITYMGISFLDFVRYLTIQLDNILIIKADCVGNNSFMNFELFEGKNEILKLSEDEKLYKYGDFCFVDYSDSKKLKEISQEEIAEILYLGHMFEPMRTPFFEALNNRFVYLSHDDDYCCRVFFRELSDFFEVLERKIIHSIESATNIKVELSKYAKQMLHELSFTGMVIDFDSIRIKSEGVSLDVWEVGTYKDMDQLINEIDQIKKNVRSESLLIS